MLVLLVVAGILGNLLAAYFQTDVWNNLFTPVRFAATLAGIVLMLLLAAIMQSRFFIFALQGLM